jgi:acylphosphatase
MKGAPDSVRVAVNISGRVQGVFFRASAVSQAQGLGLTGWVRNCDDGSVELVVEGARAEVDKLLEWCRRGPPGARVERVDVEWQSFQNEFRQFSIRR